MQQFLYPNRPLHCILSGPSSSSTNVFLSNLFLIIINGYEKIYIYSPRVHQDFFQKLIKCSKIIYLLTQSEIFLNEEDTDVVIDEVVNNKDFKNLIQIYKHRYQ